MDTVIKLQRNRTFTLGEARDLLPIIKSLTTQASRTVDNLVDRIDSLPSTGQDELAASLEERVNEAIEVWQGKIERLGATPKGLWIVDFDFGGGYFCWKFPEKEIGHWHDYDHGFSGRKPIDVWQRAVKA